MNILIYLISFKIFVLDNDVLEEIFAAGEQEEMIGDSSKDIDRM